MHDSFTIARFLSLVKDIRTEECWEWGSVLNSNGYGRFMVQNKHRLAHRVSYEIFFGEVPDGLRVCHRCDNRLCVNPMHLWLGTQSENLKDAVSKGRMKHPDTRAEKNGNTKLTWEHVRNIRAMHNTGVRKYHIASLFGVSPSTVGNIVNQETWKDQA